MNDVWASFRIGDVAEVFDGPHATPEKTPAGPWFLSISSLVNGRLDLSQSAHLSDVDFAKWTRRVRPVPGDTLFSYETRLGECAYWSLDCDAALGRRMGLLRPKAVVDPRFLAYAYQGPQFQGEIRRRSIHGATVDRIPIAELPNWEILLPPLAEQRRIAGVLGALDDLIEVNRGLIADLESLASALYRKVIAGLPSSITSRSLASTVDVISGGTPKTMESSYWGGSIPWFSVVDTPNGSESWVVRTEKTITDLGLNNCAAKILPIGSTIVTARGTVGNTALVGVPMAMSQSCYALSCRSGGKGYFNFYRIRSAVEELNRVSHGSVFSTITRDTLESVMVPGVPDAVVRQFDAQVDPFFQQMRGLIDENRELAETRDELLPLLMSGRVRVAEGVAA